MRASRATRCRGGRAGPRRGASCARTRTLRSRWTLAPSSASSERRAAVPISPTLAPPLPIRIPFCDSVSAQISARTVTRPSSRALDLLDLDLDRVRDLLAGPVEHLLADQLGQEQLARLVAVVLGRVEVAGPRGPARRAARPARRGPRRSRALIGKTSSTPSSSAASASTGTSSFGPEPVDLVDRADRRQPGAGAEQGAGDEAVAGADPLLAVDHEQGEVGVGELALDPVLHALGEHVARALHAGQVDEDELAAGLDVGGDAADRPPRRLRPHRDDRDVAADDRVDQRRLADVGPAGEADEAGAASRAAPPITRACRASISPSSVSWS